MNKVLLIGFVFLTFFLVGCSQTISDITKDENINENVHISGTVKAPLKVGSISGYTLEDENGDTIIVATSNLPDSGNSVRVSGTLKEGILGIGYYIDVQ